MLLCKNCGPRPVSEFRKHHRRGYQNQCISCRAAYNREHYKRNKQRYLDRAHRSNERYREYVISKLCSYLREHPCRVCGEADAAILEFHHKDSAEKEITISRAIANRRNWSRVLKEIKKCSVLCPNCHKRHHVREKNTRRWRFRNEG